MGGKFKTKQKVRGSLDKKTKNQGKATEATPPPMSQGAALREAYRARNAKPCTIYRRSKIGECLEDTLDELVLNGTISPLIAEKVLLQFDKSINDILWQNVKETAKVKGKVHTYRKCDDIWSFYVDNAEVVLKKEWKTVTSLQLQGRLTVYLLDSELCT